MILSCNKICKSFGVDTILDQINFHINEKEKVAIVGINGAGKSTLFKIILGLMEADSGKVNLANGVSLSYLAQNDALNTDKNIYDEMITTKQHILDLEAQLEQIQKDITNNTDNLDLLDKLNHQYTDTLEAYEKLDGYSYKSYVKGILIGLGFSEEDFTKSVNTLSGGQKTRLALAKLLIDQPDLLLLDEPTNHLDIKATEWLETYLSNYKGTLLIISHDRYFLDKIIDKVIEVENKHAKVYTGNYTHFIHNKNINSEIAAKHFEKQQKEIKRQEEVIRELRSFKRDKFITRAKSREKALNKLEVVEKPMHLHDAMHIRLDPKYVSGNDVLHVENLAKSYGPLDLFESISYDIKKGEKVALIGPNGVGKSTMFKILLDQVPADAGSYKYGAKVYKGYYDQEHEAFNEDMNLVEDFQEDYPKMSDGEIRNLLAAFLFTGDDVFKPIAALSGGERGRLSLAKLMVSRSNFLLLDEPTNHLDIVSKGILENALTNYTGTVFFISHDRYFINQVATKIYDLSKYGITTYYGNYNYYLEKRDQLSFQPDEEVAVKKVSDNTSKWLANKEKAKEEKKRAKALNKCEAEIADIEERIEELDAKLCLEEIFTDHVKATELTEEKNGLEEELEALFEAWEELHE